MGVGAPLVNLDPARLPRAAEYLASLPQGLDSFPGCRVRDITVEPYASAFGHLAGEGGLPAPVADLLRGIASGPWYPEVVFQVAHLVVRDRVFDDDASFFEWIFNANALVFEKPILRNLMRLVSPTLVVLGATKRWGTFHAGSELTAERLRATGERAETLAHLKHPAGVFSRVFLLGLERVFLASLLASRARDPQVKLGRVEPAGSVALGEGLPNTNLAIATYAVSWRA
jgi:hypothetical protein